MLSQVMTNLWEACDIVLRTVPNLGSAPVQRFCLKRRTNEDLKALATETPDSLFQSTYVLICRYQNFTSLRRAKTFCIVAQQFGSVLV